MVAAAKQRTGDHPVRLMTSDDYPAYKEAILHIYGSEVTATPTGRDSKRMVPEKVPPPELTYATVEKRRRRGRVVEILVHLIFGTLAALAKALRLSKAEPTGQRLVPGAVQRDRPAQERPEGAEDVHVLEGLAGARVDDLFYDVQR